MIMKTDKQLTESYDINTSDNQMHAIDVIMQVLERHVGTRKQNPNSEDNILRGDKDMARCVKYVLSRLENS